MSKRLVFFGSILLALPFAVQAEPASGTAGARASTNTATRVAAAPEASGGALLSAGQSAKVREYVRKVMENVAVGTILPSSVALYPLPADLGVKRDYRYSVVNEHTVLVEAKTRKVTQIID